MDLVEFHANFSGGKFETIIQGYENKNTYQDDLIRSLVLFYNQKSDDAFKICQGLENDLDKLDTASLLKLRITQFMIYEIKKDFVMQNKIMEMISEIENSVDLTFESRDNTFWTGMLLMTKGLNNENKDSEKAIELIDKAVIEFQRSSHRFMEALAYFKTAKFLETLGKYPEAIKRFETAMQYWQEMNLQDRVGTGLNGLGQVYRMMADYGRATEYFEKAIAIYNQTGNRGNLAISVNNMGIVNYFRGNFRGGLEYYTQSMEIFREINNREGVSAGYGNIAIMHAMLTEYDKAEENFKMSLRLEMEMENTRAIGKVNSNLGSLKQMQGEFSKAMEYFEEARIHRNKVDDKFGIAETHYQTAMCYNSIGETQNALDHANKALEIRLKLENKHAISRSLKLMGDLLHKLGDGQGSIDYLQKSLVLVKEIGNATQVADTLISLVEVTVANEHLKETERLVLELQAMTLDSEDKFVLQNSKYADILLKGVSNSGGLRGMSAGLRSEIINSIDEILKEDPHTADFEITIYLFKIEILLSELGDESLDKDTEVGIVKAVEEIVNYLQEKVTKEKNYDLQIRLFILQSRLARYLGDEAKTLAFLGTAATVAQEKELLLLGHIIELETDLHYLGITSSVDESLKISEFERFIQFIKQDIQQFYQNLEFHYYKQDGTLCGLTRQELQKMETEYNMPKTSISKCSQCRQKLFEDAFHEPIISKIIGKACHNCSIVPQSEQAEEIFSNNVSSGNLVPPNFARNISTVIEFRIDWFCVNQDCNEKNEIVI